MGNDPLLFNKYWFLSLLDPAIRYKIIWEAHVLQTSRLCRKKQAQFQFNFRKNVYTFMALLSLLEKTLKFRSEFAVWIPNILGKHVLRLNQINSILME